MSDVHLCTDKHALYYRGILEQKN